jgi:hypothetical protein
LKAAASAKFVSKRIKTKSIISPYARYASLAKVSRPKIKAFAISVAQSKMQQPKDI